MALNIFQTYKYHELVDKKLSLYKVSEDGIHYGIANSPFINGAIEIVPMKIHCGDIGLFKRVFNPLYHNRGFDQITGIYLAECMKYTIIDKGLISLLNITSETSDGSFIIGRGWHHFFNDDGDFDWDDFTYFGMLDKEGNSIIPSLFEEIEERTDIWDGYYVAKFRRYYSGTKQKLNGELDYAEGNGDLYLFTKEGKCVLARRCPAAFAPPCIACIISLFS